MEFLWNMDDGFVDALVRGWRSTFLTDLEYTNLKEGGRRNGGGDGKTKEDFEDMRLSLQETDYGNFLTNEPSLDPKLIGARATEKWVKEFKYFRSTATGDLARFLDFVAYEYVIDNILDLIKAATSSQSVDVEAVVEHCHPLGRLDAGLMKSILAYENLGDDFHALYRTILVDTPVGRYFTLFLAEVADDERATADAGAVRQTFSELPMTMIENSVKKFYLEDFAAFVADLGGETAAVMGELLATRADMLAIHVTYNSLSTTATAGGGKSDAARGAGGARTNRASLFPSFGHLYPNGTDALTRVEDEDGLRRALGRAWPEYAALWDEAPVDALELAFEGQFHYAPFYAYAKLKEQEVKNLVWIATCLEHGAFAEVERIIPVFSRVKA